MKHSPYSREDSFLRQKEQYENEFDAQKSNAEKNFNNKLANKILTEQVQDNFVHEIGELVILVLGTLTLRDQIFIQRMREAASLAGADKPLPKTLIVVHNHKDVTDKEELRKIQVSFFFCFTSPKRRKMNHSSQSYAKNRKKSLAPSLVLSSTSNTKTKITPDCICRRTPAKARVLPLHLFSTSLPDVGILRSPRIPRCSTRSK